jgi:hypothetical protein
MGLDDTQRTILGTFAAGLAVTASPARSLIGTVLLLIALRSSK